MNLLVAVRSVGEIRNVKTRNGIESQVRDLFVFDHTHSGFKISLWDPEQISRFRILVIQFFLPDNCFNYFHSASHWKPRVTILFMTDMKIDWNTYFKCATATLTLRTVVTEDPIGHEAQTLRSYARTAPLQNISILDQITGMIPDRKLFF